MTPYRGHDRRQSLAQTEGLPVRALLLGGALVATVFLTVNVIGGMSEGTGLNTILLQMLLEAGAAALAVVVGLLCIVRWRLIGEAGALWAGIALVGFGTVTMALSELLPLVYEPAVHVVMWLRPSSRIVTIALLVIAVASAPVDGRLRLGRLVVLATALTGVLAAALHGMPDVAQHVTGAADAGAGMPTSGVGSVLIIAAWAALATAFLVRGQRETRPLLSWLGLMIIGFALAELSRMLAANDTALWSAGAHVLRLTALALGVVGATVELQRAYHHQGRDLMDSVVATAAAEARVRAGRQEVEERAHEARNALASIEGATQTLERYHDQLDPGTRESLVTGLSSEIRRLQRLVSADQLHQECAVFKVSETLAPVVTGARSQEVAVLVDIDEGLTAFGRWADTAEVVQNLIENARRYAPGSPLVLRARREGGRVLVRLEDRGPGVDRDQHDAIFRRGVRGRHAAEHDGGSGLGLFVSVRLMRDQDGDLWVEDRPGGGAAFVVALPTDAGDADADRSAVGDGRRDEVELGTAALDQLDEAVEAGNGDGLPADPRRAERRSVR